MNKKQLITNWRCRSCLPLMAVYIIVTAIPMEGEGVFPHHVGRCSVDSVRYYLFVETLDQTSSRLSSWKV
ncbi:MAG: hypothetical protein ACLUD2_15025 [Clostridium sp.]